MTPHSERNVKLVKSVWPNVTTNFNYFSWEIWDGTSVRGYGKTIDEAWADAADRAAQKIRLSGEGK